MRRVGWVRGWLPGCKTAFQPPAFPSFFLPQRVGATAAWLLSHQVWLSFLYLRKPGTFCVRSRLPRRQGMRCTWRRLTWSALDLSCGALPMCDAETTPCQTKKTPRGKCGEEDGALLAGTCGHVGGLQNPGSSSACARHGAIAEQGCDPCPMGQAAVAAYLNSPAVLIPVPFLPRCTLASLRPEQSGHK